MKFIEALLGFLLILIVALDSFETVILPRRVARKFRPARLFYTLTWEIWSAIGRKLRSGNRREYYLSFYGPFSLILLLALWATGFILAFALIQWGLSLPIHTPEKTVDFGSYLYLSGTTFVTLGLGDLTPMDGLSRFLTVIEAGMGLGFLALVISYVPVIYQTFSRREVNISLLDARAGSPPSALEMLRRNYYHQNPTELVQYLHEWERWSAELLESHLSYPVLAYYRSQHQNQSWLGAITAVLDSCALLMAGIAGKPAKPVKFTFAMARHAVVDLAQAFGVEPMLGTRSLSSDDFAHLRTQLAEYGIMLNDGEAVEKRLQELVGMYDPFVAALAHYLVVPLPEWVATSQAPDDWQTSAWDHLLDTSRRTGDLVTHGK